jgi:hypothetical protein
MKTRWKLLIAAGIFLALLLIVSLVSLRLQPENEVEVYKKALRAQGEKLELSEVLPPPVSPESNSVLAVEEAFRRFGSGIEKIPDAMKMVAPGKALVGWQQPDVRGYGNGEFTNSWEEFTAEVAASRSSLELLHEVLERPQLSFQLDYKQGIHLLLPHLVLTKRATQKLTAAVVCDLHNGNTGAAVTNILTALALIHRNAAEGLLISHLVRLAKTAITIAPTWELLQATNVPDAQLAAVQAGWEQLNFLSDAENAFTTERVWMNETIRKSRASHKGFQETFGMIGSTGGSGSSSGSGWSWPPNWEEITEHPRYAIAETMWRSSWSYADELYTLHSQQIILETLRSMQTNHSQFYKADNDAMTARLTALGVNHAQGTFFRMMNIPDFGDVFGDWGFSKTVLKSLRVETARRVVVTAIALKRFQLQHGQLPEALGELAPTFLPSVPIDPYDGKPLRYQPNPDGTYLLYSVGPDGKDDGGNPTNTSSSTSIFYWQDDHARDWVWPQPATPFEIQKFYSRPHR